MTYVLSMTESQHCKLRESLFTGDGKEHVAWVLCGHATSENRFKLVVNKVIPLEEGDYICQTGNKVTWKTQGIIKLFDDAEINNQVLVKFHCHPNGGEFFSDIDNESDRQIFNSIYSWVDNELVHASCIMMPDGKIIGRVILPDGSFESINHILTVGYDIHYYTSVKNNIDEYLSRNTQAFGEGTQNIFKKMRIGIAGCSGTGSQVIEQLVRLGIGELVLVDNDVVEEKNLNRITNVSMQDAYDKRYKVHAIADTLKSLGLKTKITTVNHLLQCQESVKELSTCDVVFGCLDTISGRHLLNRLCSFYIIPYFDLGVRLDSNMISEISGINCSINYIQPGLKSLMARGLYTSEDLQAENQYYDDPESYKNDLDDGYVKGVNIEKPAVIPVNAFAASMAVLDFLARLHDYRPDGNHGIDKILLSVSNIFFDTQEMNCQSDNIFLPHVGRGDVRPLLDMPVLS